jgi:ankyrin repeat protein
LLAARDGHETVVKLLLAKEGVDPDSRDSKYGQTPLSWAAENGHEAVVKLMLAKDGVDTNLKDNDGRTPLSWAASNGHDAVVKLRTALTRNPRIITVGCRCHEPQGTGTRRW